MSGGYGKVPTHCVLHFAIEAVCGDFPDSVKISKNDNYLEKKGKEKAIFSCYYKDVEKEF